MRFIYPSSLFFLLLLVSCTLSENEQAHINKINKLEEALDSVSKQYFAIDTSQLVETYNLINANLSRLSKIDTVVNDSIKLYAAMQKSYKRIINDHPRIVNEFHYSSEQLKNLKADIRNGGMKDKEMEKYYFQEMEATGALISKMQYNAHIIDLQLHSFAKLNEYVELTITQFNSK